MPRIQPYNPSVPVVMRILANGSITVKEAAEILQCSQKQIQNLKAEFGVDSIVIYSGLERKKTATLNKARRELMEILAKQVKYEKGDITQVAKEHNVPLRSLYRWLHNV